MIMVKFLRLIINQIVFNYTFVLRDNKFANVDCHFTIQCSKQMPDSSFQLPIVVLHLNFPPPVNDKPTLLTFGNVFLNIYILRST